MPDGNIYTALAAAQGEMGKALKDSKNPHFKSSYADLASVMDACVPALTKHGIALTQPFEAGEMGNVVKTVLTHGQSNTSAECAVPILMGKQDMQGLGSAYTYARRYGLMAMAGIAPEDDDGNAAVASGSAKAVGSIIQAWKDGVDDSLPENATQHAKGIGYAEKMLEEIPFKATAKSIGTSSDALENYMNARKGLLDWLAQNADEKHGEVMDAYLNRKNHLSEEKAEMEGNLVRAAE